MYSDNIYNLSIAHTHTHTYTHTHPACRNTHALRMRRRYSLSLSLTHTHTHTYILLAGIRTHCARCVGEGRRQRIRRQNWLLFLSCANLKMTIRTVYVCMYVYTHTHIHTYSLSRARSLSLNQSVETWFVNRRCRGPPRLDRGRGGSAGESGSE